MEQGMSETERNWPDSAVFWQEKWVIVTGGTGFLGSFVVHVEDAA